MNFLAGLCVGVFIGAIIGMIALGLCASSAKVDDELDRIERERKR
jgi:hypothetical protein